MTARDRRDASATRDAAAPEAARQDAARTDPAALDAAAALDAVVLGQCARDLVLRVEGLPAAGESADVVERLEMLGGKGANQAVGMRQLGLRVALLATVGADAAGDALLRQLRDDGIDAGAMIRRGDSALMVDIVEPGARRRLLESTPEDGPLSESDVRAMRDRIARARVVALQLQQPAGAMLAAGSIAASVGATVIADGSPKPGGALDPLARVVDVWRLDSVEAALMLGRPISSAHDAALAAADLRRRGPRTVAIAVPREGDLISSADGERLLPLQRGDVIDPTGGGDAFIAGLAAGLAGGRRDLDAATLGSRCAAAVVRRLGGRPDLTALAAG